MITFVTTAPTIDDVFNASKLRWQRLGISDASDLDDPPGGGYLTYAIAYMTEVTGRYFSDWPVPHFDEDVDPGWMYYGQSFPVASVAPLAATPTKVPLARQAVQLRTEQIVMQAQPNYVDTAADDLISSMSVGGYSETRRDSSALRGGRMAQKPMLNSHPTLNMILEDLMTEGRYEFWLIRLQGTAPPAMQVEEVVWDLIGKDFGLQSSGFGGITPWTMFG